MRPICLLALAVLMATATPATAAGEPRYRKCAQVEFTPRSDDLAADVRVRRVSCRYARAFIRDTNGAPPARHRRWRCVGRLIADEGLQHTKYRCSRGKQVMRWSRY